MHAAIEASACRALWLAVLYQIAVQDRDAEWLASADGAMVASLAGIDDPAYVTRKLRVSEPKAGRPDEAETRRERQRNYARRWNERNRERIRLYHAERWRRLKSQAGSGMPAASKSLAVATP